MTQQYTGAAWTTEPGAIVFLKKDESSFTDDEVTALLNGGMNTMNGITAAAAPHTGAMIAFIPATEFLIELMLPDGEALEELHCTVLFLGEAADIDDEMRADILEVVGNVAERQPIIVGNIFSFNVFNPNGAEPCVVAGISGEDLLDARESVVSVLEDIDAKYPMQHMPWIPHITLQYDKDPRRLLTDELMSKTGPIIFDRIRVAFGNTITDFPLGGMSSGYNVG